MSAARNVMRILDGEKIDYRETVAMLLAQHPEFLLPNLVFVGSTDALDMARKMGLSSLADLEELSKAKADATSNEFVSNAKVRVIKRYRELTGQGLKDAKDVIEAWWEHI